jgi:hypothetical protein
MALNWSDLNDFTMRQVLPDRESIKQAIKAMDPEHLELLKPRCAELGLDLGEVAAEAAMEMHDTFLRLRGR